MNESKPSRDPERPAAPAGRDPNAAARNTPSSQPAGDSAGSRAGSTLGTASERTGLGDGTVQDSSQGLAGAQGSGGGADRRPAGAPMRSPAGAEGDTETEPGTGQDEPRYRPDEEAS